MRTIPFIYIISTNAARVHSRPPTGSEGRHAITSAILTLLRHQPLRPETAARFPRLSLILRAAKRRSDVRISRIGAPEVLTFLMADAGRFFLTNITAGFLHMYGRALKLEEFDVGHACDSLRKLGDKMRFDLHLAPLRLEMISQTPEGASSVLDLDAIREAAISLTYSNDEFRTMHLVACMTRLESLCLTVHERIRPSSGLLDIAPLAALPSLRHLSFDARKVVLVDWTSTIGALAGLTALTFLSFQYGLTLKAVAQPADDANAVPLSIPPPPPPPHPLSLLALLGAELKALDLGAGPPDYDEASSMAARSDPFSFLEHLQGLTALTILRSANCLSSLQRSLPSLRRLSTIIAPGFSIVPLIFPALRELSLTDAENTITSPDDPPPLLDLSTMPALRAVELTHQPRAHRQALPAGYGGRILLGPGTKKLAVVIPIARPAAMEGVAAIAQMEEPSEVLARFHPLPPNLRAFSLSICGPPRSFGEPPLTLNTRPDLAAIFAMIGEASRGYSPRPNLRELSLRMPLPVFAEAGDRADNVLEPAGPRGEVLGPLTRWIPRFPYLRSLRLEPSPELRTRNVDGKDAEQGGAFGTAPNQLGRMLREVVWRDVPQLTVEVVDS